MKDYKCIFTSGATAALKLVGEAFPWSHQSSYMYTMENHNSVLGIREYPIILACLGFHFCIIRGEKRVFNALFLKKMFLNLGPRVIVSAKMGLVDLEERLT